MPDQALPVRASLPGPSPTARAVHPPIPRAQRPRAVPLPRTWSVTAVEIVLILVANGVLILAMWVRHGGLDQLSTFGGILTGVGQVTALFGTYLALIQLVLMSRSPWLDQVFGMDRLAAAHRWIGFATVWLLLGHGVFTTIGYGIGDRQNPVAEFLTLVTTYPYVLMATVSGGLFAAVAISSIRAARRRLSYETWYGIHLYAYLAIALGFLHQLFVGTDFIHDPVAVAYWVALYAVTVALVAGVPCPGADPAEPPAPAARRQRGPRGTGRLLDLRHRSRPRPARRPVRPVLRVALPDPRRLVAWPSVLDLVGAERVVAPDHDQGAGRLVGGPRARRGRHARLRRRAVRHPDRRPADPAAGAPHRRRDRDHAVALAARGAARQPRAT